MGSVSDSSGCVIFEDGMTTEQLATMIDCKEVKRARLSSLTEGFGTYHAGESPWSLEDAFRAAGVIYIPGKAANAGGVGVSGLEMAQNAQRLTWKPEEVDTRLKDMMAYIYQQMEDHAPKGGTLEQGANIAGFIKVVQGMKELGWFY